MSEHRDELTVYLNKLLEKKETKTALLSSGKKTSLHRFRAAAHATRDVVSLAQKAKELGIQS